MFTTSWSQEQTFTVELSSDSVLLGNYIEVSFVCLNIDGNFSAPSFEGMQIVGGPNQSSSMSSINGNVKKQMTYSYYIEPQELGEYYIAPATIETKSNAWETEPIKVIVKENPEGIIEKPSYSKQFNFEFGDIFGSDPFGREELLKKKEKQSKSKVKRRKI